MRDKRKDQTYFEDYITQEEMRITKFQAKLDAGEVRPDRIVPVREKIVSLKFQVLIAKYSMGESVEALKEEYVDLLGEIEKYWRFEMYTNTMWMVSLAILLDVDRKVVEAFITEVKKYYSEEWLMSFLLYYYADKELEIGKKVLFEKPYGKLKEIVAIKSDGERVSKLKKYLQEDWYMEIVKMLVNKGIDVNAEDKFGAIPLSYAVTVNKLKTEQMKDIFSYLLEQGADAWHKDSFGKSCVDYATEYVWRNDFIQILKEYPPIPNRKGIEPTPCHKV